MSITTYAHHCICHVQAFFVDDKSMPGWCVVLKKEARGKRITSTEVDYVLGQEESMGDRQAFPEVEAGRTSRGVQQRPR